MFPIFMDHPVHPKMQQKLPLVESLIKLAIFSAIQPHSMQTISSLCMASPPINIPDCVIFSILSPFRKGPKIAVLCAFEAHMDETSPSHSVIKQGTQGDKIKNVNNTFLTEKLVENSSTDCSLLFVPNLIRMQKSCEFYQRFRGWHYSGSICTQVLTL